MLMKCINTSCKSTRIKVINQANGSVLENGANLVAAYQRLQTDWNNEKNININKSMEVESNINDQNKDLSIDNQTHKIETSNEKDKSINDQKDIINPEKKNENDNENEGNSEEDEFDYSDFELEDEDI